MKPQSTLIENLKSNKPLLITIIVIFSLLLIAVLSFLLKPLLNEDREYTDPLSNEVVYNPVDRTPEDYNQANTVTYLGFTKLIDRGVSFDTVQQLKDDLSTVTVDGEKSTEMSVDVSSIKHFIEEGSHTYDFDLRINRQETFKLRLVTKSVDDSYTFEFTGDNINKLSLN